MGDDEKPKRERFTVEVDEWAYGKVAEIADKERRTIKAQFGIAIEAWLKDQRRDGAMS